MITYTTLLMKSLSRQDEDVEARVGKEGKKIQALKEMNNLEWKVEP